MRIWDSIEPSRLCRQHLLGEHRELHAIWSIHRKLQKGQLTGYTNHPEVKRWAGHLWALDKRHTALVKEMKARGINHKSPLVSRKVLAHGTKGFPPEPWDDQEAALAAKGCECSTD